MYKRRSKFVIIVVFLLIILLLTTLTTKKDNIQLEFIKDLISQSKSWNECDLDWMFNHKLLYRKITRGNCDFTTNDLSGLIGMYEISKDFYYIEEALKIVDKDSSLFNTPSGIPGFKTVNVDIFSKYALEYYYLGDLTMNFTLLNQVDRGLQTINSLLELNRTVSQVNIQNPFKSINSRKPTKLFPVLLKLYMSTGSLGFKEMYSKSLSLITPQLKNLTREECYFPQMMTQYALLEKDSDWTFYLHLAHTLLEDYCLSVVDGSLSDKCTDAVEVDYEIYFYMYRLTQKSSWRDLAWDHLLSFGKCLDSKDLRFAYLLFSKDSKISLDEFVFSNGFPQSKRGFGKRITYLPLRQQVCLDCVDGYGLDSLLNGAFSL